MGFVQRTRNVGLIASCTGVQFDDVKASRIDWPTPASPTWQVYAGDFDLANSKASLTPVGNDMFSLAVREGTYGRNYDIETQLQGPYSGIAFRVKDKLNYYCAYYRSTATATMTVIKVVNGQRTQLWGGAGPAMTTAYDSGVGRHIHIQVSEADLGIWMEDPAASTWRTVLDPGSGGNGNGLLYDDDIRAGSVGLVRPMPTGTITCSKLRVGSDDDSDHELDPADEAWVDEAFAATLDMTASTHYDPAGNLIDDGIYRYKYDAWNRLVEVTRRGPTSSPQVIASYGYDGLGRRIKKVVSHSGDRDRTEYFYYNQRWQLLEIRRKDQTEDPEKPRQQFVWGIQYFDEAICMDVDTDGNGDCTDGGSRRFSYCQDANWNVVALRDGPTIVERYDYDAYGTGRVLRGWDTASEDGSVAGASLQWLVASLPENPIRFCGYYFDNETTLYHVRHRMYNPSLQRWCQRDPLGLVPGSAAGYQDGLSLYQYVKSQPSVNTDPLGLKCGPCAGETCCTWTPVWLEAGFSDPNECAMAAWKGPWTSGVWNWVGCTTTNVITCFYDAVSKTYYGCVSVAVTVCTAAYSYDEALFMCQMETCRAAGAPRTTSAWWCLCTGMQCNCPSGSEFGTPGAQRPGRFYPSPYNPNPRNPFLPYDVGGY